jgi:glycosyltransferase involved in cell wall biosynthesis
MSVDLGTASRGAPAEPPAARDAELRLAYLCNRYPAISHTFILGEILALRRLGAAIATISLRRSDRGHLLAPVDQAEFATTHAILPVRPWTLAALHLRALARQPRRYLGTLAQALRLGRGTARGSLWQLFYFAEAVLVWERCRRERLRHIHAQFTSPSTDVAMLAARLGDGNGPWSFSFAAHGTDILTGDQGLLAEKVRRASFVICVSDFGRSQLMGLVEQEHWPKLHVVRCGIDTERFRSAATRARTDPVRLLAVGRLHPVKGHAILLEALRLLLDEGVSVALTLVGDGPLRASLERRAAELGVGNAVTFAGNVGQDAILDFYEAADVFCLPSFGEGIPVVLMEAMAMRLPVVASGVMGIPELVDDGLNGLLVPPGRPDRLAAALGRLIDEPALRRELGESGRAKVADQHDSARNAEALLHVMRACLSE